MRMQALMWDVIKYIYIYIYIPTRDVMYDMTKKIYIKHEPFEYKEL